MKPEANKAEQADFIRTQVAFAAHIRDPEGVAAPGDVEARRMAVYRELFYNNVEGFVSSGFPVLRSLYDDEPWHALVREFFIKHRCQTPYFLEISQKDGIMKTQVVYVSGHQKSQDLEWAIVKCKR